MDDIKGQRPTKGCTEAIKQTQLGSDVLISPGLSIHFFGKTVGIYSSRITPGKGFVEMQVSDLQAIADFLRLGDGKALLEANK